MFKKNGTGKGTRRFHVALGGSLDLSSLTNILLKVFAKVHPYSTPVDIALITLRESRERMRISSGMRQRTVVHSGITIHVRCLFWGGDDEQRRNF